MMRLGVPAVAFLLFVSPFVSGQTASSLAAYDETILRQAGVNPDAASLLTLLRQYTHGNGDAKKVKALIGQLGSAEFEQRENAARDLIAVGRPALDLLRAARKSDPDPEIRLRAGHCIDAIENSFDANVIFSAVRHVIQLRAGGAAESLLAILPDADWEMQDEIFHGLPRVALRDGKLDPALLAAFDDKSPMRRAAAGLAVAISGSAADRALVRKLLPDADPNVRLRAAQGLLAVGDATSLPVLIALLNEPQVDVSWSAEELLHWAAGDTAPAVTVGGASAAERKKVVEAWTEWQRTSAAKLDWKELANTPRRPGLCFLCEANRTWLCGCDGTVRWTLPGQYIQVHDLVLLPNNQLLVAPLNGEGTVILRDLSGKEVWKHTDRNGDNFLTCQRLPDGHFLLATEEAIYEVNGTGQQVAMRAFDEISLGDSWKLRNGHILCRHEEGVAEFDGFNGSMLRDGHVDKVRFNSYSTFAVFPDGRCVVADYRLNRLLELDPNGKLTRTLSVRGAWGVEALRNGNYLVSTMREGRVVEVDPEGRAVWEVLCRPRTVRVRSVLDKVRIGFEKPRPAVYNLDSAGYRVRGLKDPNVQVRRRSAEFLVYLKPTDEASIAALVAALDDPQTEVRLKVAEALGQIGSSAMPALIQTLKKGTAVSRCGVAYALQQMGAGAEPAVPALLDLMRDGKMDRPVRLEVATTLGTIGHGARGALPTLLEFLKGDDDSLRYRIGLALPPIAPEEPAVVTALITALKDDKYPQGCQGALLAISALGARAKAAVPELIAIVRAGNESEILRISAVNALAAIGPEAKAAGPTFVDMLKDSKQSELMRCAVARKFGLIGADAKTVLPVYSELLRDPNVSAEFAGAMLIGLAAQGKEGVPVLALAVNQGSALTRRLAINQLVELGEDARPALPALKEAAKDADPTISRLANRAARVIELGGQDRRVNPK